MDTKSRISNGSDVAVLHLVPCTKSKGNICENGDKNCNQKKAEMFSTNGIQTYKRRKHSQSSSEDMLEHARILLGGQEMDKNSAKEQISISDVSRNKPKNGASAHVITGLCQRILNDVLLSEKCDMLCKLLTEIFQGIKFESISDFKVINERIRDGYYDHSPQLFSEDIQQLWSKLQNIGLEMVSLAKGLSDMSRRLYHERVGGSVNGASLEGKHEEINQVHPGNMDCSGLDTTKPYPSLEADRHSKPGQVDSEKNLICMSCKGKTDGRISIVCDHCEKMYHVFCVGVSVNKDCPTTWYCKNCASCGLQSPHENCVVCERLKVPCTKTNVGEDKMDALTNAALSSVDEKSNCFVKADVVQQSSKNTVSNSCKLCGDQFVDSLYRECQHSLCRKKFHLKCLSELEIQSVGPRWYCPSCLCRVCLADKDDEKIVLCDGCDNAYHIYCMEPRLNYIPKDKWFCNVCSTRLQKIQKGKSRQKKGSVGKVSTAVGSVSLPSSATVYQNHEKGSMDVLLSAMDRLKE
ncbi:Phd finger protein ehd3 [Thalictrum thalictroides]|uniref:Phd finger protein ehd3 n=1 Tax=Thalictrum thalictroides TaxID=46969 RepID=A0A7J6W711_THATH|nr:Phd finger protein ehd3 [Thalictrum thalictroides]